MMAVDIRIDSTTSFAAALVVGVDSHGLAVVRALASEGVSVYAVERKLAIPGLRSRHIAETFSVDDFSESQLLPALRKAREALAAYSHVVLFLTNDRQVGIVGRSLAELSSLYLVPWSSAVECVLSLQMKDSLERFCVERGMNYPKSHVLRSQSDLSGVDGFSYPIILKPVQPLSSFKTFIAHSRDEARLFLCSKSADLPILCQEFIEGGDEALYFGELLLDQGRSVFGMTGRKVLSHPPAQGQASAAETHVNVEVLKLTERFFTGTTLSGPAALELKRAPDGKFWVIEPTIGRTEFLVELCISAGFNQPWMVFQLALNQAVQAPRSLREVVWYDAERDPLVYLKQCLRWRSLSPRGKRPVFPYWGHGDWSPWVGAMVSLLHTRLAPLLSRLLGLGRARS